LKDLVGILDALALTLSMTEASKPSSSHSANRHLANSHPAIQAAIQPSSHPAPAPQPAAIQQLFSHPEASHPALDSSS